MGAVCRVKKRLSTGVSGPGIQPFGRCHIQLMARFQTLNFGSERGMLHCWAPSQPISKE
jgi:hypothetical protein